MGNEAHATAKTVLGAEHPHTRIFAVNLKGLRAVKAKRAKKKKGPSKAETVAVAEAAPAP